MSVNIKNINDKGEFVGDILPEYIPPSLKEDMEIEKEINSITDGYSPDRTLRKIASIDTGVLYNYAMLKGIHPTKHADFWADDNGKNLIKFLEEFPAFKLVHKI